MTVSPTLVAAPFFDELVHWLPDNSEPVRPLVALSTITADGYPDTRHVLLSEFDEIGFYFHTDARSRKIAQLTRLPRAAFTVAWPELGRQLVVLGDTEPAPTTEAQRAYGNRSPYLKTLAWLNSPELAALPIDERIEAWRSFDGEHESDSLLPPATWAGILLRPTRVTLWHAHPGTASRRLEYTREAEGTWASNVLPG
ncbi:pyridoxamine 5'-phosphate oxidase family protein [Subtercola sp. PAMC28395]|uniref:pyridoxamine 5'-phosphate oxidase family protein n=1 Tax=Subtercola sp. PAMC28395 TaxID=2846775 RepID=UPI001C0B9458|nr:pyridoxamine 5'-phosphate oxidase family protein [Subtercola sp. PAMC28395]QWT22799.1 pyridoxamine 5'-phosphate oxidase family protein [Subtercola sp. PAMC28395]